MHLHILYICINNICQSLFISYFIIMIMIIIYSSTVNYYTFIINIYYLNLNLGNFYFKRYKYE